MAENLVDSLPDGPIPETTLSSLEDSDHFDAIVPMMWAGSTEKVVDFILEKDGTAYVFNLDSDWIEMDGSGWKVTGEYDDISEARDSFNSRSE